jgi:ATP/maltotriose-dependent transcriptional regulator MalT
VGRPAEMAELERVLLPERQSSRRKTLLLHGLGGIGKTQLAIEFARQHHYKFSAVFWLDGRSEDSLKRSIVSSASRITEGHISKSSRIFPADSRSDIEIIVQGVLDWLARQNNTGWLLIFDNVDREYSHLNSDPDAYDVTRYFPSADHGSILITTRLAKLELDGHELHLGKVDKDQAKAILRSQFTKYGEETHYAD